MFQGLFEGIFAYLYKIIRDAATLKRCRVNSPGECNSSFEYKGKYYDKDEFCNVVSKRMENTNMDKVKQYIAEMEKELPNSKYQEYDEALIEAYKLSIGKEA